MLNVSENLLRSRIPDLPDDHDAIARKLKDAGYTVDRVVPLSDLLRPVVVGKVESLSQHPNADRLKVCVVDDGSEQRLQIVTGATNVEAGAFYPVIRGGVSLPNGRKIKPGKLRGETSEGMLGSADELELGTDHAGLMTLPHGFAPGTPLIDVVPTPGVVFILHGNPPLDEVVEKLGGPPAPKPEEPAAS